MHLIPDGIGSRIQKRRIFALIAARRAGGAVAHGGIPACALHRDAVGQRVVNRRDILRGDPAHRSGADGEGAGDISKRIVYRGGARGGDAVCAGVTACSVAAGEDRQSGEHAAVLSGEKAAVSCCKFRSVLAVNGGLVLRHDGKRQRADGYGGSANQGRVVVQAHPVPDGIFPCVPEGGSFAPVAVLPTGGAVGYCGPGRDTLHRDAVIGRVVVCRDVLGGDAGQHGGSNGKSAGGIRKFIVCRSRAGGGDGIRAGTVPGGIGAGKDRLRGEHAGILIAGKAAVGGGKHRRGGTEGCGLVLRRDGDGLFGNGDIRHIGGGDIVMVAVGLDLVPDIIGAGSCSGGLSGAPHRAVGRGCGAVADVIFRRSAGDRRGDQSLRLAIVDQPCPSGHGGCGIHLAHREGAGEVLKGVVYRLRAGGGDGIGPGAVPRIVAAGKVRRHGQHAGVIAVDKAGKDCRIFRRGGAEGNGLVLRPDADRLLLHRQGAAGEGHVIIVAAQAGRGDGIGAHIAILKVIIGIAQRAGKAGRGVTGGKTVVFHAVVGRLIPIGDAVGLCPHGQRPLLDGEVRGHRCTLIVFRLGDFGPDGIFPRSGGDRRGIGTVRRVLFLICIGHIPPTGVSRDGRGAGTVAVGPVRERDDRAAGSVGQARLADGKGPGGSETSGIVPGALDDHLIGPCLGGTLRRGSIVFLGGFPVENRVIRPLGQHHTVCVTAPGVRHRDAAGGVGIAVIDKALGGEVHADGAVGVHRPARDRKGNIHLTLIFCAGKGNLEGVFSRAEGVVREVFCGVGGIHPGRGVACAVRESGIPVQDGVDGRLMALPVKDIGSRREGHGQGIFAFVRVRLIRHHLIDLRLAGCGPKLRVLPCPGLLDLYLELPAQNVRADPLVAAAVPAHPASDLIAVRIQGGIARLLAVDLRPFAALQTVIPPVL